jgi:hypothetical protein
MLTDYFVHCPYHDCGWRGSLFPIGDRKEMQAATFARREVSFCCKRCSRIWQARLVHDDAVNIPTETSVPQAV